MKNKMRIKRKMDKQNGSSYKLNINKHLNESTGQHFDDLI